MIWARRRELMNSAYMHLPYQLASQDTILIKGAARKLKGISNKTHSLLSKYVDRNDPNW